MTDTLSRHNAHISGDGEPTLVFAHGFGCDQAIWHGVSPAFQSQFRVVLFDLAGCGRADPALWSATRHSTLDGYSSDLIDLLDDLGSGPVVYVGHSVSGAIGFLAAIRRPELFQRVIAIGPSPRYINQAPDYFGGFEEPDILGLLDMMERNQFEWAGYLAPQVMGNSHRPDLAEGLRATLASANPITSRRFAEVTFLSDIRDQLPRIPVPVSILYCSEDIIVPLEVVDFMRDKIPDCRTQLLEATGHYPHMSNPDAVIRAIGGELEHHANAEIA